jgi:hypothetical protein
LFGTRGLAGEVSRPFQKENAECESTLVAVPVVAFTVNLIKQFLPASPQSEGRGPRLIDLALSFYGIIRLIETCEYKALGL